MPKETVGRPMEILLVEDSLTEARLTTGVLKKADFGHRLTWIRDGEEALEFLFRTGKFARAPVPDLILLDLGLPKKDGREVLQRLRSDLELNGIPVVIMTASTEEEDIVKSRMMNVEAYMTKPINFDKFMRLVTDLSRFWREDMILPKPH
jgi:two-component system response regulator